MDAKVRVFSMMVFKTQLNIYDETSFVKIVNGFIVDFLNAPLKVPFFLTFIGLKKHIEIGSVRRAAI